MMRQRSRLIVHDISVPRYVIYGRIMISSRGRSRRNRQHARCFSRLWRFGKKLIMRYKHNNITDA